MHCYQLSPGESRFSPVQILYITSVPMRMQTRYVIKPSGDLSYSKMKGTRCTNVMLLIWSNS